MSLKPARLTPLQIIPTSSGDVLHGLTVDDHDFTGFGEAYFSLINSRAVKGWKKHLRADCNLLVPFGSVRFYVKTGENNIKWFDIGASSYSRLFIPCGTIFAFEGLFKPYSVILNISSLKHDPNEVISYALDPAELPTG